MSDNQSAVDVLGGSWVVHREEMFAEREFVRGGSRVEWVMIMMSRRRSGMRIRGKFPKEI